MFIEPTIMKAVRVPTEYTLTEAPVENLKTYVFSNVQKFGKGPEAWRSTTNLSKHELFGANVQAEIARLKENEVKPKFSVRGAEEIANIISASTTPISLTLENDITLTATIEVREGKNIEFDLGGNKLTANNQTAIVANGGNVTIKNGEIIGTQRAAEAVNGGTVIVKGGNFKTTSEGQIMDARGEGSKLIVDGGTFEGQETALMAFDKGEVIVNDGEFNTIDNFAIGTNGTDGRGGNTVIINKAVLNCGITSANYEACGIYVANNDKVVIGPEVEINVTKGCGILMRAGEVEVKSGVKINLTTDNEDFTGYVGDNKTKMTQSGIIYHESANYPGKAGMKLTVDNGVTINAINHSIQIISNEITPNVTIGQGTYNPAYPELT